ncbi:MAG: MBL fold metallo-hydrolase [Steroidobacteraceae bacterium]
MRIRLFAMVLAGTMGCTCAPAGESPAQSVTRHVESARRAAGVDHGFIFGRLCEEPIRAIRAAPATGEVPAELPGGDADRKWYAEPARVFDDLFFLGQTAFSVWGLRTSAGIILVDSIFDYSVEAEVLQGLRKLGMDPADIRYVIISHAHADHSGGAGILQRQDARIVMSEADWKLYEQGNDKIKARRDIVATDGMPITLGNTTVRVYLTPGHTHGTLSTVLPVHDNGTPHVAALWGGTLFNFRDSPDDPRDARLALYAGSAAKFREVARAAGADILLSNHTAYDGTTVKLPQLATRKAGQPHPYVIGTDAVQRYLTVAQECAIATRSIASIPSGAQ